MEGGAEERGWGGGAGMSRKRGAPKYRFLRRVDRIWRCLKCKRLAASKTMPSVHHRYPSSGFGSLDEGHNGPWVKA